MSASVSGTARSVVSSRYGHGDAGVMAQRVHAADGVLPEVAERALIAVYVHHARARRALQDKVHLRRGRASAAELLPIPEAPPLRHLAHDQPAVRLQVVGEHKFRRGVDFMSFHGGLQKILFYCIIRYRLFIVNALYCTWWLIN